MNGTRYTWTFIAAALIETGAFNDRNNVDRPGAMFYIGDHVIYQEGDISMEFIVSGVRQNGEDSYTYSVRTTRGDLFPFCFYEFQLSYGGIQPRR